jgi:biopolymer transport protein ExbB
MHPKSHTLLMRLACLLCALALASAAIAQSADLDRVHASANADLRSALDELARIREEIAGERIPLARQRNQLEQELLTSRRVFERLQRQEDNRAVELTTLERAVTASQNEQIYVRNLLEEFLRSLEAEAHVGELPHLSDLLSPLRSNVETEADAPMEAHLEALGAAIARLRNQLGGQTFTGEAAGPEGDIVTGTFAFVGPMAFFAASNQGPAGWAEERVGSLLPQLVPLGRGTEQQIRATLQAGEGILPIDVTGGDAVRRSQARESLWQQVRRGGVVMVPILLLAVAALGVAILKWIQIAGVKTASPETLRDVLDAVREGEQPKALNQAAAVGGPVGELLRAAVQNANERKELIEEILYEKILEARPRLERFLPFLALTAATAPLLGLLGTVTGMINTFQVITLFGTGDARTLSGGISEALITTKFGLAIAIAALLVHALLSRRAKGVLSSMEQTGVAFLNGLPSRERDARG